MPLNRAELASIFGDDFEQILEELARLNPEIEFMLQTIMDNALYEVEIFQSKINKQVGMMQAQGISQANIISNLSNDLLNGGLIFGSLRTQVKESVVKGINESGRIGQYAEYAAAGYDENSLWRWIVVSGHRICPDCLPRKGQVKTYAEWVELGLPATSSLICGGFCYCILDPLDNFDSEVQLPEESTVREKRA